MIVRLNQHRLKLAVAAFSIAGALSLLNCASGQAQQIVSYSEGALEVRSEYAANPFAESSLLSLDHGQMLKRLPEGYELFRDLAADGSWSGACDADSILAIQNSEYTSVIEYRKCTQEVLTRIELADQALELKKGVRIGQPVSECLAALGIHAQFLNLQKLLIHAGDPDNLLEIEIENDRVVRIIFLPYSG